jgi:hypothetical protein
MKRRSLACGTLVLLALSLAGCAPAAVSALPSSTGLPSAVATPTPTATPAPTRPELGELTLSPDGLGPLVVGAVVPDQPSDVAVVSWDQAACAGGGEWVANYPSGPVTGGTDAPFSFPSAKKTDPIGFMTVWSSEIKTGSGVGVGSTVAELQAAYPDLNAPIHAEASDLYVVTGSTGELVFEVATRVPANFPVWTKSAIGTVVWVQIQPAGKTPTSETTWQGGAHCFD